MSSTSENLIHFLGRQYKESPKKQFEIFKSIITEGLRCSKIQVKFTGGGFVFNQVVCFTDIPLNLCDEHTATYGKFGIGFKKSYLKRCGGNPVRYFVDYLPGGSPDNKDHLESRGSLFLDICGSFNLLMQIRTSLEKDPAYCLYDRNGNIVFNSESLKNWVDQQLIVFSFEKELGDLGPARDETTEVDLYYKEREWRLVPLQTNVIKNDAEFKNGTYYFKFERSDVNMIVTPNDEVRTEVIKYLLSLSEQDNPRLKQFADNPPSIISYDDLKKW